MGKLPLGFDWENAVLYNHHLETKFINLIPADHTILIDTTKGGKQE